MKTFYRNTKINIGICFFVVLLIVIDICYVNNVYGEDEKQIYQRNTELESNGYVYKVFDYDIIMADELDENVEVDDDLKAVLLVKLQLCSKKGKLSVSGANLMAQSNVWGNSMDPELFLEFNKELINSKWDKKIDENEVILTIPFPMYGVQFYSFDAEDILAADYELVVSLTPYKSVILSPGDDME